MPKGFEEEVLASVRLLSPVCVENFLMVDLELRRTDPETGRCGLLGDRFEVYAVPIPQCPSARMIVSFDLRARRRPGLQHGAASVRSACDRAMTLVERHRRLLNPVREA